MLQFCSHVHIYIYLSTYISIYLDVGIGDAVFVTRSYLQIRIGLYVGLCCVCNCHMRVSLLQDLIRCILVSFGVYTSLLVTYRYI